MKKTLFGPLTGIALAALFVILSCNHPQPRLRVPATESATASTTKGVLSDDSENDPNSQVGLYTNPTPHPIEPLLQSATQSIDIEIYEMSDPHVRALLREALDKGIRIQVVMEPNPIGQKCDPWAKRKSAKNADCLDQQLLVQQIQAHGGAVVPFDKQNLCGQTKKTGLCFQHGKMILIDKDQIGLISTGNFNSSNLCDLEANPKACNRDFNYVTTDHEVLSTLAQIFANDLKGERYDMAALLKKGSVRKKLTVSPYSLEPLKEFIRSAHTRLQIQNQYINPDSGLAEVLIEKAQKDGVQIELQVTDVCAFGRVNERKAYNLYLMFAALENAGVKVRMFNKAHRINGKPGYLHAKVIVVDGERAWLGSVNGSSTSLNQNREFGIFYSNKQRVEVLSQILTQDFNHKKSQTWRDSLSCHNVGYEESDAYTSDDSSFKMNLDQFKSNAPLKIEGAEEEPDAE